MRANRWQGASPGSLRVILPGQSLKGGYNFTNPWLRAQVLNSGAAYAFTAPQLYEQRNLAKNTGVTDWNMVGTYMPQFTSEAQNVGLANSNAFANAYANLLGGNQATWANWAQAQGSAAQANQGGSGPFGFL